MEQVISINWAILPMKCLQEKVSVLFHLPPSSELPKKYLKISRIHFNVFVPTFGCSWVYSNSRA